MGDEPCYGEGRRDPPCIPFCSFSFNKEVRRETIHRTCIRNPAGGAGSVRGVRGRDTAADDGPVVLDWVGLRLQTPGGALYPQPDSPIIQEFNKALNIDLRPVKSDFGGAEEMNLLFATGEIPHHMLASQNNMLRYKDEGLLRQIPLDMVKQHAPTYWRDYANDMVEGIWFDFPSWDKDTESLWALPNGGLEIKHQIVVRGDWLEAVGASLPTTVEEYAEVARQFTFDDPDGNGQKDTWGLATSATSSSNWTNNLATFLAAFGYEHIERPYLDPASGEIMFFEVTGVARLPALDERPVGGGVIHPDVTLPDKLASGRCSRTATSVRRRHLDLRAAQVPARHLVPEPVRKGSQRHGGVRGPVDRRRLRADLGAAPGAVDLPRHRQDTSDLQLRRSSG